MGLSYEPGGVTGGPLISDNHMYSSADGRYIGGSSTLFSATNYVLTTTATPIYTFSDDMTKITTGVYAVRLYLDGGGYYSETWGGILTYYGGSTNSSVADDVYLQGMGHARTNGRPYLRIRRWYTHTYSHRIEVWVDNATTVNTIQLDVRRIA